MKKVPLGGLAASRPARPGFVQGGWVGSGQASGLVPDILADDNVGRVTDRSYVIAARPKRVNREIPGSLNFEVRDNLGDVRRGGKLDQEVNVVGHNSKLLD